MKTGLFAALALAAILVLGTVADGQGRGNGARTRNWSCPYGYTTPNPSAGGWWTRVTPATPEQEAFLKEVTRLHDEIRTTQFQLFSTQDPSQREPLEKKLMGLRTKLHELQLASRSLKQQMMQTRQRGRNGNGGGGGRARFGGGGGYGSGLCPFAQPMNR